LQEGDVKKEKMKNDTISQNQYISIILSSMIGIGILSLSSNVSKLSYQQGWISIFLGGVYPIITVIIASIINKKTNNQDYWEYSTKVYGKIITIILTIIFYFIFLTLLSSVASGYTNVINYSVDVFLPSKYILIPVIMVTALVSINGLKIIGRICELFFYLALPIIIILIFIFKNGTILNVQPIFYSFKEIMKGIPAAFYSYAGVEVCYIVISHTYSKTNKLKAGLMSCIFTIILYTLSTIVIITNLGWELTSNLLHPLIYIMDTIRIPIISNFSSLFIIFWSLIIIRVLLCFSYAASYCLSKCIWQ
jgi:spore germination protein